MEQLQLSLYRMIFNPEAQFESNRFVMFDLDHCLIQPKNGRTFPRNADDWKWVFPDIPDKLNAITDRIIVITNQAQSAKFKLSTIETKLRAVFASISKRVDVYIATAKDKWRKPNTTIFEKYLMPSSVPDSCCYIGDAAGRPGDHSDTDRAFAYNLYLLFKHCFGKLAKSQHPRFYTETEYFKPGVRDNKAWRCFNPSAFLRVQQSRIHKLQFDSSSRWLIIMVGPPASGKSTTAQGINLPDLVYVSQDELGSKQKALKLVQTSSAMNKNIVVDATNPTQAVRKQFLDLAESHKTCIVYMNLAKDLVQHLNCVRVRENAAKIPKVAYNVFYKKFEHPLPVEADEIKLVPFIPDFKSRTHLLHFLQRTECN